MNNSFDEKILEEAYNWFEANQKVVLATVIQTWGSSPRQIGSKMIVNEKGDFSGALSSAKNSKTLAYIAIGLLIFNIVYLYFLGGIDTYQDILEIYNL